MARGSKEVIHSAIDIGLLQLLIFSRIRHEKHFQQLKIPVISNMRVSDNLLHIIFSELHFEIKNQSEIQKPIASTANENDYYMENSESLAYKTSNVQRL